MKIPSLVLMTSDTIGGIWTYTLELCSFFERQGIEVILAVTGEPASASQKKEIHQLKNVIYYEKDYKLEWMDNPWNDIRRSGEWLLNLEHKYQPDIIHLNSYSYGSLHWQAPVIVVGHTDKLSWWKNVRNTSPPPEWSEYYQRVYNGLHGADFVVAPSRYMLQNLNIIYGDFLNQSVIYNGRNKDLFTVSVKKDIIVTAGRVWDEAKNIKSVVDAAPNFLWKTIVAGSSMSPLNNEQTKAGSVSFTGRLSLKETAELFASASIFLLPAKYEPFGFTPLEAALSGCAIVLGKTASLLEIWDDAALFVTPNDAEELIFVVNYLTGHKGLLKTFAVKAHRRALDLSSRKMGQAYLSLYRRLIRNKVQNHKAVG